jgi:hypothetical protein
MAELLRTQGYPADWDIAGAGDWRFDLVNLAFACQLYPSSCAAGVLEVVVSAVNAACDSA